MQNSESFNLPRFYPDPFLINGIKFTSKEVEIISCMLSGKSAKTISTFLSVSPKTIESHLRNIMIKVGCNSRDGIVNFIEKSDKFLSLKEYYLDIFIRSSLKKTLEEIKTIISPEACECHIVYWPELDAKTHYISQLTHHLLLVGIKSFIEARKGKKFLNNSAERQNFQKANTIYFIPEALTAEFLEGMNTKQSRIFPSFKNPSQNKAKSIFIVAGGSTKDTLSQMLGQENCIDFLKREKDNFITLIFEILEKLFPTLPVEKAVREFQDQYKKLQISKEVNILPNSPASEDFKRNKNSAHNLRHFYSKWFALLVLTLICVGYFGFSLLKRVQHNPPTIRSDLIIPVEAVFIDRPEFISQIDNLFRNKKGIQTIALVGPGGAGKTTLARQYAHIQKANLIWEINAETHESLRSSFELLANALAKTDEDKNILRGIQEIKDAAAREEKIILFVKERLYSHPGWFLIFDNVEKFINIQKYFPQDHKTWGQGKILLTTRDSNIQNNKHINGITQVGELSSDQKFCFFTKIMNQGNQRSFTSAQAEEVSAFLEHIPSFPLDVSIAAYYLKTTNTSYQDYLKNLAHYNNEFANVQKSLLKETGDYTKTRYGVIVTSIEHIVNIHKDFRDLLLFISLLESQNIPKDLLEKYKNTAVVDNFIYNLKKHSLITSETILSADIGPTFSIHRSTQAITQAYLIKLLNLEKNKQFTERIGKTLKNYAAEMIDKEDYPKMNLLIKHCEMFLSHPNLSVNFVIASINNELGNVYMHLGNYEKAKQLLEQSLVIYRKNSYENNPWFARTLVCLGCVYRDLGNYEKAKQLFEEGLTIYRKTFFEGHSWYARALACLGSVYIELASYEKAKQLLEQSLVFYRKNSLKNHTLFARSLTWLGIVYKKQGDYEKAKQFLEEGLTIYRKNFYENHPEFARALIWRATVYKELGYYENARRLLEQSLTIYKKNFCENHPWFAHALGSLGSVHKDLGNHQRAKQLYEQSLAIHRKNSYENHPWFAQSLAGLGIIYTAQGNYKEAKDLLERSLQIYEKIYGKNHVDTARALRNLGQVYLLEGHLEMAENCFHKALVIFHNNNHPDKHGVLEDFADLYLKKYTFEKGKKDVNQSKNYKTLAISCLKQAFDIVKTSFSKDSRHILRIETKLKNFTK